MFIALFECEQSEYIDRIDSLHYKKEYEQWIKFFLKVIIFAADDSLNKTKEMVDYRTTYDIIELYPIIDVNTLAEKSMISYNTASAVIKLLCDLGIMKQSNNMERNRDYAYIEFLDCFVGEAMLPPIQNIKI